MDAGDIETSNIPVPPVDRLTPPRKPERANGFARYNQLVEAVKELIGEQGTDAVTIKAVAKRAGVPIPSVYHFFPNPLAACMAAAESYRQTIGEILGDIMDGCDAPTADEFILRMMRGAVDYYNEHHIARRLILSSGVGWCIRQIDIEHDRRVGRQIMQVLHDRYQIRATPEMENVLSTCSNIVDAIWSVSTMHHDHITDYYHQEAHTAVMAYIRVQMKKDGN